MGKMSSPTDEERKNYAIGRTVSRIRYLAFAIRATAVFSLIALIVLYLLRKPLWLSPVIGIVMFLLYRSVRRFIITRLIRFGRESCGKIQTKK